MSSSTGAPDVSIVIPTRNRAAQLRDALRAVAAMKTRRSWELVVVDNGSTDSTPDVLAEATSSLQRSFVLVSEPTAGVSRALNRGWRDASGEIVAFTADDCYPAPDYVDRLVECFAEKRIGFVGGPLLRYDTSDDRIATVSRRVPLEIRPGGFVDAGTLPGANLAFRREVLEALGGFDEALGLGTPFPCEDADIVARASSRGWAGAYDPRPVVYHHHRRQTSADVEPVRRAYDRGRGAFYAKCSLDPELRNVYLRVMLNVPGRIRARGAGVVLRELQGSIGYLVHRAGRRGRR